MKENPIYENKTNEQKVWISNNEVCKALYKDERTCDVENTGCRWKHMDTHINDKNEKIEQPAYCSNIRPYPE